MDGDKTPSTTADNVHAFPIYSSEIVSVTSGHIKCFFNIAETELSRDDDTYDGDWYGQTSLYYDDDSYFDTDDYDERLDREVPPQPIALANCSSAVMRRTCLAMHGPNGAPNACVFKRNKGGCVNSPTFEDNAVNDMDPERLPDIARQAPKAECTPSASKRECRAITGPNGGPGACLYKRKRNKCVTNKSFIDLDVPLADCTKGTTPRKCRAIRGPNGGPHACRYNKRRLACVNNKDFEDNVDSRGIGSEDAPLNVLLIMADDVSADSFGVYGSQYFDTPRLDQLAAEGVYFRHMHATPICTPSRNKIMTGRSGIRNYVTFGKLDREEVTFGHMMQAAGYRTAFVGKKQLRPRNIAELGFDSYSIWLAEGAAGGWR
jgi:hypothetical protein